MLTSDSIPVHYDPDREFVLACDTSPYGVRAVLSHRDSDGRDRPIAFALPTLAPTERKYSQLETEGLAIVFGVKRFHSYPVWSSFHYHIGPQTSSPSLQGEQCLSTYIAMGINPRTL